MTKADFIQTLKERLMGEVSSSEMESTVRYYEDYIEDARRNGRSEQEVLDELGSPLLIARTIIETAAQKPHDSDSVFQEASKKRSREEGGFFRQYDVRSLKTKIIAAVVLIFVLFLIFTILKVLIPIVVPILMIYFLFQLIKKGGRS